MEREETKRVKQGSWGWDVGGKYGGGFIKRKIEYNGKGELPSSRSLTALEPLQGNEMATLTNIQKKQKSCCLQQVRSKVATHGLEM